MSGFIQTAPSFESPYSNDELLNELLDRFLDQKARSVVHEDFLKFEKRIVHELETYVQDCTKNPPRLVPFSPWGERLDDIETCPGWKDLDRVSSEEGIVAIGYERKFKHLSRFVQFLKLYLFHPSSAYYSCPLAMTDGAARLIEVYGDQNLKNKAYKNIISRNPSEFWTSGQWMTERSGGSDISKTETTAVKKGDHYILSGVKWFTSATTSQMAMTLARIVDEKGNSVEGSRGLSLFYIELRDEKNKLNGIEILRLKDKLGTKALPTAELKLEGTKASLVGEIGQGVKTISTLFNITRIYNATTTVGAWKRILDLAVDYSKKRQAFKKLLKDHPLHFQTLARARIEFEASFHLVSFVALLLGIEECQNGPIEVEEAKGLLRLLTPIAKLYTAKKHMGHCSELIESFGGAGYIEDTGLPTWLRDAQVFTIWEGTTNVLSLDVHRAMAKENAFHPWVKVMTQKLNSIKQKELMLSKQRIESLFKETCKIVSSFSQGDPLDQEAKMRALSFAIGDLTCAALMLEHAEATQNPKRLFTANQFSSEISIHELEKGRNLKAEHELLF